MDKPIVCAFLCACVSVHVAICAHYLQKYIMSSCYAPARVPDARVSSEFII